MSISLAIVSTSEFIQTQQTSVRNANAKDTEEIKGSGNVNDAVTGLGFMSRAKLSYSLCSRQELAGTCVRTTSRLILALDNTNSITSCINAAIYNPLVDVSATFGALIGTFSVMSAETKSFQGRQQQLPKCS